LYGASSGVSASESLDITDEILNILNKGHTGQSP